MGYSSREVGRSDQLTPLFRSASQGRILAALLLARPEESMTVTEIARRARVPSSTAHREVGRLERYGLVTSQRFAQSRVVRPNEHSPYIDDLRSLVVKAYGPAAVVGEALAAIPGVEGAYIFGSWAARLTGESGPPPDDVDVLIVGDPDRMAVDAAMQEAEEALGREVQATVVSLSEWEVAKSPLLQTIMRRPLVAIVPTRDG